MTAYPKSTRSQKKAVSDSAQDDPSYSQEGASARSGLSWAMALARVEFASILAAFTETPDPYVSVRPTAYELPAYKELLLDAAAMHYWGLARDPGVKQVRKISPANPAVLAYSRRMGMARKMVGGLAKASAGDLYPVQYRELGSWGKNLGQLHVSVLMMIRDYLTTTVKRSESSRTSDINREFVRACTRQLEMEREQLLDGRAKIIRFDAPSTSSSSN